MGFLSNVHIKQSRDNDCGIACLYMLFHCHKLKISYYQIKKELHIRENGISLREMIAFLKKFGVSTKILKIDNILNCGNKTFDMGQFPCIGIERLAYTNHYIIIYSIKNGIITFSDPLLNSVKKESVIEFMGKLEYLLITTFPPKIHLNEIYKEEKFNKIVILNLKKHFYKILKITFFSLISSIVSLLLSTQLGQFINLVMASKNTYNLYVFTEIYIFLLIMYVFFLNFKNLISVNTIKKIERDINIDICNNIFEQLYNDFIDFKTGDISSRISDLTSIALTISNFFMNVLADLILIIFALILLINISYKLTMCLFSFLILNFVIAKCTYRQIFDKNYKSMESYSKYYSQVVESINNYTDIKSTNSENFYLLRLKNKLEDYIFDSKERETYTIYVFAIQTFLTMFTSLIIIVIGSYFAMKSNLTVGNLSIFVSVSGLLQGVVSRLVQFQFQYESFSISLNRIKQIFSDNEGYQEGNMILNEKIKYINFSNFNISFDKRWLIKNSTFNINKKNVFIRGKSGVGKSTFAKTISGLLKNYDGTIEINGIDMKLINPNYIRKKIIYVPNEIALFEGTLRENICLDKMILDATFKSVCDDFKLTEIIENLPYGLDYKIFSDKSTFSTGEKQRIAIARAILIEPDVIVLDEALSNIDNYNKAQIYENLQKYDCIKIFITHERDIMNDCQILEFDNTTLKEKNENN